MDVNNIKIGSSNPDAVMFDSIAKVYTNNVMTFGNIIAKDSTTAIYNKVSTTDWQINDGWEVEIISSTKLAIKKFKIDTWGLRQIIPANTHTGYNQFKVGVSGIDYVHKNIICHTAGSTTPDGFTRAYGGTGGYNVYWYPGQFTSGNSMQGLVIQFGVGYGASNNEREDSLQIGKHPWDVGTRGCITDSVISSTWADGSYRAITIGLYGGVQNAASWHDETGDAYKVYDISDHPIYVDLKPRDTTKEDPSSVECWDAYIGDTQVYHKDRNLENCWDKYGYVAAEKTVLWGNDKTPIQEYVIKLPTGKTILPKLNDYSCLANCKFHGISPSNTEIWNDIRDWYKNNTISGAILAVPSITDDGGMGLARTFWNCTGFSELTLNLAYNDSYNRGEDNWYGTGIEEITFNTNYPISSPQRWFRGMSKLKTIKYHCDSSDYLFGAASAVDMFGGDNALEEYPAKMINWGANVSNTSVTSKPSTLTQYTFNACKKLKKVPSYVSGDKITCCYLSHMFTNCNALTTIEPILDVVEQTCAPSGADAWFDGCNALTSVKIKGLSHGDWYFDGSTVNGIKHGDLSNLDEASVQYLFANLADLTTCNPKINKKAWYNNFSDWVLNQGTYIDESWGELLIPEYVNEDDENPTIYNGVIASVSDTAAPAGCKIKLAEAATTEGYLEIVFSNNSKITIDVDSSADYYIIPTGVTGLTITAYDCVVPYDFYIAIETWNSSNPLVSSATLNCPSAWGGNSFDLTKMTTGDGCTLTASVATITSRRDVNTTTAHAYILNTSANIKVQVQGLTEGDVLGFGRGASDTIKYKITQDGEYELELTDTWGFRLWNTSSTSSTSPVTITSLKTSAKVTDEMITAAKTKGWTIKVGGTTM